VMNSKHASIRCLVAPRSIGTVLVMLMVSFARCQAIAQEVASLDRETQTKLRQVAMSLAEALKSEDEAEIRRQVERSVVLLGDQAGLPESPDQYRGVPQDARPLSADELPGSFDPYILHIERMKWWRIGLDPTQTNHTLREVAAVIEGCLSARQATAGQSAKLLAIAEEAGEFLIWAQAQAESGVLPFPAVRNGKGRPFEVAERFYRRAEQELKLHQVIRNGWTVEDFEDGGLQFDNGLAGVALIHLYEATRDDRYKKAAIKAADWAVGRILVPNWNYNSFSVYLLAEAYRISGNPTYLNSATEKAVLGVLPGQLTEGPRRGRWADPHNARPPYHYIMIRGLAALAAVMPQDDPDLPIIIERIRLALCARNPDFQKGILDGESSVEALVLVDGLPEHIAAKLKGCETEQALSVLQRYAAHGFRTREHALGPGAWGYLLVHRKAELR
jgi:hypothetical protein